MKFPLLAKVGAIALVGLMLMVVLMRIEGLVYERKARGEEAVRSVEHSHAAAQAILGPVLERACSESWESVVGEGANRTVAAASRDFRLQQVPDRLSIAATTQADPMWRGLFKVNAWKGRFAVDAEFTHLAPLQPHAEHPGGRLTCDAPVLLVSVSDVRGALSAPITIDGHAQAVEPGTAGSAYASGLHTRLPAARVDEAAVQAMAVHIDLDLVGTGQLAWVPAAGSTHWTLHSDWPHPSFGGQFLPATRDVRANGFDASWNLSAFATTAPTDIRRALSLCAPAAGGGDYAEDGSAKSDKCLDLMSVAFIDPINPYVLSDRAIKYDLLFIVLTFVAVGLIEVLSGRRVHPVQYALVGLALSLFFLLLLSLSEHLPFEQAYAAAALACALLLGAYATSMLGRRLAGLLFGIGIALLYGLLYALLQMEQNALVIGSVMLFAALATVMMLTRRIDWYALFARLRTNAGARDAREIAS
ncbi:cell envelope integrity protein CreD [Scleromatobacter humisilvae]|uniref:Cell envelope integrity protein CreD n=1 Tax=Scleromatobacter humisilvae TaxID=2897159 RepID=A0A9X1YME2_9BURK|nr:cell envelope integrity protein CreD [Scleromatobacter humisilvae]MCK9688823.1 cell envelope integrity protein CreD [Scleromatobacter humisilvae]